MKSINHKGHKENNTKVTKKKKNLHRESQRTTEFPRELRIDDFVWPRHGVALR
jgi:hypothetical protein